MSVCYAFLKWLWWDGCGNSYEFFHYKLPNFIVQFKQSGAYQVTCNLHKHHLGAVRLYAYGLWTTLLLFSIPLIKFLPLHVWWRSAWKLGATWWLQLSIFTPIATDSKRFASQFSLNSFEWQIQWKYCFIQVWWTLCRMCS